MSKLPKRQTLGFEGLVRLVKQLSLESLSRRNGRTQQKLGLVIDKATQYVQDYPFHAPVLAHHISRVTSKLDVPGRFRCVTCGGTCEDIHTRLLQSVDAVMHYQSPKGLTQLQAIYSVCSNPKSSLTILQLELRSANALHSAIRAKAQQAEDIDNECIRLLKMVNKKVNTLCMSQPTKESQSNVLNILEEWENIARFNAERYRATVTLRDVCAAVTSVRSDSPLKELLLYLGAKAIEQLETDCLDDEDIKSVCRILSSFTKNNSDLLEVSSVARGMKQCAHKMNLRDLACLLSSLKQDDIAHGDAIFLRIEDILCGKSAGNDADLKSICILMKQLASLCQSSNDSTFIDAIEMCSLAIIRHVGDHPEILLQKSAFSALVISLKTMHSLNCAEPLQKQLMDMVKLCIDTHEDWVGSGRLYDLNELLSIIGEIMYPPSYARSNSEQHGDLHSYCLRQSGDIIESIVMGICKRYLTDIERRMDAFHDVDFMRNLCQFLRICQSSHIGSRVMLPKDFNTAIHQLFLSSNGKMKTIDADDIAAYLEKVSQNYPGFRNIPMRDSEISVHT
ncbi:hypothetical protein BgAZ_501390 [Babesia gibsoni]|uniref:Uncharacterized protein n=1 Tax=Babesia gibsoni TaxID=33632 RepID=A0AAD8LP64_BABGI|nr:hypothetical protein BgAZ_501390 [Babesia gibsoni]